MHSIKVCVFNPRCVSGARIKKCEFEFPYKIKIDDGHYIWCINPPFSKSKKISDSKESPKEE